MTLIELLLLAVIIAVLAILIAGCYALLFKKRFSFLKRPYPEVGGKRLSQRLVVPPRPTERAELQEPDKRSNEEESDAHPLPASDPQIKAGSKSSGYLVRSARTDSTPAIVAIAEELSAAESQRPVALQEQARPSEITGQGIPSIPWSYGNCAITALVRDPYWLFVYWAIDEAKRAEIARRFGRQAWDESRPVLRIYDTTNLYFFDSRQHVEISINDYANNWYIHTGQPNRTFCVELGRICPDGSYIFLARSNLVSTPRDQISDVIDEEWLLLPEYAAKLYQRIGGIYPGPSSPGLPGPGNQSEQLSSPMKW